MPRTHTKKTLFIAPSENAFWVHHGPIVHDLQELKDALARSITDEQFKHHVTGERNDFAIWIDTILHDKKCANAIKRVKTKKSALSAISKCLTSDYKRR